MSIMRSVLAALMFLAVPAFLPAAEQPEQTDATKAAVESVAGQTSHAAHAEHGIPQKAQALGHQEGFVTNSMLVTWVVALGLILFARFATRRMRDVPTGAQNFWEWLVESLYDFLEGIIGHDLVRKTFWFFATIFILILFTNVPIFFYIHDRNQRVPEDEMVTFQSVTWAALEKRRSW